MKPVKQTTFGYPRGNCYAACVASLLEIPLEACPIVEDVATWNEVWDAWYAARGLARMCFEYNPEWKPRGWAIISGISPRVMTDEDGERVHHSCVGCDGELVHDPHPDDTFLEKITDVEFIYAVDPSRLMAALR